MNLQPIEIFSNFPFDSLVVNRTEKLLNPLHNSFSCVFALDNLVEMRFAEASFHDDPKQHENQNNVHQNCHLSQNEKNKQNDNRIEDSLCIPRIALKYVVAHFEMQKLLANYFIDLIYHSFVLLRRV